MVECNLAKVEVASSNLVSRSIFFAACYYWDGSTTVGPFFIDRLKRSLYKLTVYFLVMVPALTLTLFYIKLKVDFSPFETFR